MIKKITLVILLICTIISCGKKEDPKYGSLKKEVEISVILTNKV
tara:strand:- start:536 stop:667 length:132 start_codon:yes stop_codon:yes gene_type:complete